MQKVIFTYNNGRERKMNEAIAKVLQKGRYGTYQTASMEGQTEKKPMVADSLDAMDIEELRAMAKDLGIEVHHRAGKDKILAALRGI